MTGIVGFGSATLAYRRKERAAQRALAAATVLPRLDDLRRLLRYAHARTDGADWLHASAAALEAIDDARYRLPEPWRHLQQSVRIAIGEATGAAAFADRYPPDAEISLAAYSPEWGSHAEDYLTYASDSIREWRDSLGASSRRLPRLLAFDPWLSATNRIDKR